jgi:hypothetical protein
VRRIGRFALLFACILAFYGGSNVYIGRRVFGFANALFPGLNGAVFAAAYILLALSLILGFFPLPFGLKGFFRTAGSYWMGFYVYLLLLFVIADLVLLFLPGGARFYAGLAVILITTGIVCYGIHNAHQLKTVHYDIELQNTALQGEMTIVLIGDLHLGEGFNERRLPRIAEEINRLQPDIVCLAGDIFNDDYTAIRDPGKASELLRGIDATYGIYACLGNHDAGATLPEMLSFLERSGVTVLNDQAVVIDGRLTLFGRLDPSPIGGFGDLRRGDTTEVLASLDQTKPIVILDHNPGNIGQYGTGADLILAAHTHRGQIFPGSLFTTALFAADHGVYQKDGGHPFVIVTQGVGTWMMPMRVGTSNEIVCIKVR